MTSKQVGADAIVNNPSRSVKKGEPTKTVYKRGSTTGQSLYAEENGNDRPPVNSNDNNYTHLLNKKLKKNGNGSSQNVVGTITPYPEARVASQNRERMNVNGRRGLDLSSAGMEFDRAPDHLNQ